ncbi:MAG: phosphatase domain-containing protein [Elainellaceae cyanobacterium]
MTTWVNLLSKTTSSVNAAFGAVKGKISRTLGIDDPIHILPYRGYGTPDRVLVQGRVLADEGIKLREEDAPLWKNLWNMYRRFETDEIPEARLALQLGDVQQKATSDKEGYFAVELLPEAPLHGALWHNVNVSLLEPQQKEGVSAEAEVMVVDDASFAVVSDIDDTIVHTAATDMLKMIRIAYLGNAKSRTPFDGVPEFYQALQRGTGQAPNPIFYASSSAWNMYDLFTKFMAFNGIPKGPILLRDIEMSLANWFSFDHESHKLENILPLLERFPGLPFLLIGDSGQQDAEIYSGIAQDHPDRVLGILIRDVSQNEARQQALKDIAAKVEASGCHLFVFRETQEAVDYAVKQGWILA